MKLSKALPALSTLLSASSMTLWVLRVKGIPAYVAVTSFVMASTSFSLGAQVLSMVALAITVIPLNPNNALLDVLVAYLLALVGVIARLVLSDVKGHAPRGLIAGNASLIIGVSLALIPSLTSRPLSVAEPPAIVLVSAIASYALGTSYALGRGLRVDTIPIALRWLRGLGGRVLDKLSGMLTWAVLTALIARASTLAGASPITSVAVAALASLPTVLIVRRGRAGRVALLTACAVASTILLREADVTGLGSALRFIEEVIRYLGW